MKIQIQSLRDLIAKGDHNYMCFAIMSLMSFRGAVSHEKFAKRVHSAFVKAFPKEYWRSFDERRIILEVWVDPLYYRDNMCLDTREFRIAYLDYLLGKYGDVSIDV